MYVLLNPEKCAAKYRAIADELDRRVDALADALEGTRMRRGKALDNAMEVGRLIGMAAAYRAIAEQFDHLHAQGKAGRIRTAD